MRPYAGVAKRKRIYQDTTVPPIDGSFVEALRALLGTGSVPKSLGRKLRGTKTKPKTTRKRAKR